MKKIICESLNEDEIEQWYETAKSKDGVKSLDEFYKHLMEDYALDYGACCHAIAAAAIAVITKMSRDLGITGFQHNCIMWQIISREFCTSNKIGLRLVDYDELCYPQFQHKFENVEISSSQARKIQETAEANLSDHYAAKEVRDWWQKLATGWLPHYVKVVE